MYSAGTPTSESGKLKPNLVSSKVETDFLELCVDSSRHAIPLHEGRQSRARLCMKRLTNAISRRRSEEPNRPEEPMATVAWASGRQKSRSVSPPSRSKSGQEAARLKQRVGSEERLTQLLHQTKQLSLGKSSFVKRLIRRASFSEPEESVEHVEHEVRPRVAQPPLSSRPPVGGRAS